MENDLTKKEKEELEEMLDCGNVCEDEWPPGDSTLSCSNCRHNPKRRKESLIKQIIEKREV